MHAFLKLKRCSLSFHLAADIWYNRLISQTQKRFPLNHEIHFKLEQKLTKMLVDARISYGVQVSFRSLNLHILIRVNRKQVFCFIPRLTYGIWAFQPEVTSVCVWCNKTPCAKSNKTQPPPIVQVQIQWWQKKNRKEKPKIPKEDSLAKTH